MTKDSEDEEELQKRREIVNSPWSLLDDWDVLRELRAKGEIKHYC